MRSLLKFALAALVLLGATTALAADVKSDEAADTLAPVEAPIGHLHAKLDLPRGWHVKIGRSVRSPRGIRAFEIFNPTTNANAVISVMPAILVQPITACRSVYSYYQQQGGMMFNAQAHPEGLSCAFLVAFEDTGGPVTAHFDGFEYGYTIVVETRYPSDVRASWWQDDIETIINSIHLERR